jgi:hypothetical protein
MQKITDFLLLATLVITTSIISKDVLHLSNFLDAIIFLGTLFTLDFLYFLFTRKTEIVTILHKTSPLKNSKNNIVITTNKQTFTNDNDLFIQWHAKKLNKQIHTGHKYKITTYRLLFGNRNILSATEIKTQKRKVTKKSN